MTDLNETQWVLVPREPTHRMRAATWRAQYQHVGAKDGMPQEVVEECVRRKVDDAEQAEQDKIAYAAMIAASPSPPAGGGDDLVSRSEVINVLRRLGNQDADLALYGAADNARAREYGEAAATRACCAVAMMPAATPSTAPAPAQTWRDLDDARLQRAIDAFYEPCEGTTIDGVRAAIMAWERG